VLRQAEPRSDGTLIFGKLKASEINDAGNHDQPGITCVVVFGKVKPGEVNGVRHDAKAALRRQRKLPSDHLGDREDARGVARDKTEQELRHWRRTGDQLSDVPNQRDAAMGCGESGSDSDGRIDVYQPDALFPQ
jgi:hypothetical protein